MGELFECNVSTEILAFDSVNECGLKLRYSELDRGMA